MVDIPGYKIIRQLGRGGMATVYLAEQALVEREVALKVMAPQLTVDPSFGERFLREARIAAKLRHPHIVSIIEVGVHGDYHYAAMEYLAGPVQTRESDTLSLKATLRVVREIATALDYAHSKGVVHRDVKPDNILLREDGSAVLGDFGIARAADATGAVTRTGAVVGTPLFMSPEQLRGKQVDGRSDLYSLGVVAFQLLSGRPPYVAEDALALGIMHMTSPIPALPASFQPAQALVHKLLAKDPADRYQTGAAVAAAVTALEAQLGGNDAAALPAPAPAPEAPPPEDIDLGSPRGGRAEPTIGEFAEAVADRWRVTPRPASRLRRRRRWGLPLLLVLVLLAAVGWWQRELWLPQAQQWLNEQLGATDQRLEQFSERRAKGELIRPGGDDALADLSALLAEQPDNAQALGALAAAWPELVAELKRLDNSDPPAAQQLRARLLALRPDDAALQPPAAPTSNDAAPIANSTVGSGAPTPTSSLSEDQVQTLLDEQLEAARAAERQRQWYGEDGALEAYRAALALRPESDAARVGLLRLIDRILIDAREAVQRRQQTEPAQAAVEAFDGIEVAKAARDELMRLLQLAERRGAGADRVQRINAALAAADQLLRRGTPADQALIDLATQLADAAQLDRRDPRLRETIDKVAALLLVRAGEKLEANDAGGAEALLKAAGTLTPDSAQLEDLQIRVERAGAAGG